MTLKLQYLKKIWNGFNWWRKRYCFTRVLILLILFSPLIYERFSGSWIICDLVKIACDGIFISSIPQSENALCKFYKFKEKKRLQFAIIGYADKNRNKILDSEEIVLLRQKGCDIDAIQAGPMNLNLNKLAKNASLLDLLPPGYSTTGIRQEAFFAAHAENDFIYKPLTNEVYDLIDRQNWFFPKFTEKQMDILRQNYSEEQLSNGTVIPNYTTWGTWKNGIDIFYYNIISFFSPLSAIISWFFISVMISLFIVLSVKKHARNISISACLVFLAVILCITILTTKGNFQYLYYYNPFWNYLGIASSILFFICFSIIASRIGIQISSLIANKNLGRIIALFLIGIGLFMHNLNFKENNPYWFSTGIGEMLSAFSWHKSQVISNAFNVLSVLIMLISIFMGYRYWLAYIRGQQQRKPKTNKI